MEMLLEHLMGPFGALLMAASGLLFLVLVSSVFPIFAFLKDWRWGLACFFLPGPATLAFVFFYFKEVKLITFLTFGTLTVSVSTFLLRAFLATYYIGPDL